MSIILADMLRLTDLPCHLRKTLPFSAKRIFLKNHGFSKAAHSLTVILLKAISCDNLAEVAEKNQYCILARPDDTSSSELPVCDNDQY